MGGVEETALEVLQDIDLGLLDAGRNRLLKEASD